MLGVGQKVLGREPFQLGSVVTVSDKTTTCT
jgi:hypothetical protein